MDSSGRIYSPEEQEAMDKAARKRLAMIPETDLQRVQKMNRRQRRAWYAQEQKRLAAAHKKNR